MNENGIETGYEYWLATSWAIPFHGSCGGQIGVVYGIINGPYGRGAHLRCDDCHEKFVAEREPNGAIIIQSLDDYDRR